MIIFLKKTLLAILFLSLLVSDSSAWRYEDIGEKCFNVIEGLFEEVPPNKDIDCNLGDHLAIAVDYQDECEDCDVAFKCILADTEYNVLGFYNETIDYTSDYGVYQTSSSFNHQDLPYGILFLIAEFKKGSTGTGCLYLKIKRLQESCEGHSSLIPYHNETETKYLNCELNLVLSCKTPGFAHCYNVTWYEDGRPLDNSLSSPKRNFSTLIIDYTEVKQSIYSCRVEINGTLLYSKEYNLCFEGIIMEEQITNAASSNKVIASLGSPVELQCHGKRGRHTDIYWMKQNETGEFIKCGFMQADVGIIGNPKDCFLHTFPVDNVTCRTLDRCDEKLSMKYKTTLRLNTLKKSDLGKYTCVTRSSSETKTSTITLSEKPDQVALSFLSIALAVAAGFLLALLVLFIFLYFCKIEMKLIWKKYFATFDPDDKSFAVFLSYSYNTDAQRGVKELLHKLHNWLEMNNYYVFDQHRNQTGELHYNLIRKVVPNCHRMVIVLTPDYFTDDTKVFDAQTGINSSIEGETKLIFIITPNFKKYFQKQLKANESSCLLLKMSMEQKSNTVIYWKENQQQERCFKMLEVAMPKLRVNSYLSTDFSSKTAIKQLPSSDKHVNAVVSSSLL